MLVVSTLAVPISSPTQPEATAANIKMDREARPKGTVNRQHESRSQEKGADAVGSQERKAKIPETRASKAPGTSKATRAVESHSAKLANQARVAIEREATLKADAISPADLLGQLVPLPPLLLPASLATFPSLPSPPRLPPVTSFSSIPRHVPNARIDAVPRSLLFKDVADAMTKLSQAVKALQTHQAGLAALEIGAQAISVELVARRQMCIELYGEDFCREALRWADGEDGLGRKGTEGEENSDGKEGEGDEGK